ncbi:hypothetical protein EJ110_NYTH56145 [Nymphaea thermarum]|nr:hypothetical protein EJ110_NYTH56145 [Nymphaea thermarum]
MGRAGYRTSSSQSEAQPRPVFKLIVGRVGPGWAWLSSLDLSRREKEEKKKEQTKKEGGGNEEEEEVEEEEEPRGRKEAARQRSTAADRGGAATMAVERCGEEIMYESRSPPYLHPHDEIGAVLLLKPMLGEISARLLDRLPVFLRPEIGFELPHLPPHVIVGRPQPWILASLRHLQPPHPPSTEREIRRRKDLAMVVRERERER